MSETCRMFKTCDGYIVLENGIVRSADGIIIGRLEDLARIAKLEAAIRECMNREGFDDTQEAFDWWIEEHQPFEARTVKGDE